ncbi:MAG: acyl-CoA synthetase [Thiomargarita sp.]|nr:acyl-CoA synthetase [Thiomargarita sp.]
MLPLSDHQPIAWWQGHCIQRTVFFRHVALIAATLPSKSYAINLCEERYFFLVAFTAVIVRGQTNLLPSSLARLEVERIAYDYVDSYSLTNEAIKQHLVVTSDLHTHAIPKIPLEHIAAIVFTSGSTGHATPHIKLWRTLVANAWKLKKHFKIADKTTIVATVPPQHMYGLETSILLPLITGVCVYSGRPFFPTDICDALASVSTPRILITTPLHLKACVKTELKWPDIACIISATAVLSTTLAVRSEKVCHTHVLEIYGCTEGGALAQRRTIKTQQWSLYEGIHISRQDNIVSVSSDHFSEPVILNDVIKIHSDSAFELLGRQADMIKIAGKRASLAHLNYQLNAIEGVEDGIFIMPKDADQGVTRLIALVVAPLLDKQSILNALSQSIEAAFLPRPLYIVTQLPRNETGKLPQKNVLDLLEELRAKS